jgi:hypothetical protein
VDVKNMVSFVAMPCRSERPGDSKENAAWLTKDGGDMFLRNVGLSPKYATLQPRRQRCSNAIKTDVKGDESEISISYILIGAKLATDRTKGCLDANQFYIIK